MRLLSRGDDEAVGKCARQRLSPSDEREGKKIRRRSGYIQISSTSENMYARVK